MRVISVSEGWARVNDKTWYGKFTDEYVKEAPATTRSYGCYVNALVTRLCEQIFPDDRFTSYRVCSLLGTTAKYGTVSSNNLDDDEESLTLEELGYTGNAYTELCEFLYKKFEYSGVEYIMKTFLLDYLVNNTGRDMQSLRLIRSLDSGLYYPGPFYDWNSGMFQDTNDEITSLDESLKSSVYKPFNMTFKAAVRMCKDITVFNEIIPKQIDITRMQFPIQSGFRYLYAGVTVLE